MKKLLLVFLLVFAPLAMAAEPPRLPDSTYMLQFEQGKCPGGQQIVTVWYDENKNGVAEIAAYFYVTKEGLWTLTVIEYEDFKGGVAKQAKVLIAGKYVTMPFQELLRMFESPCQLIPAEV